MNVGDKVEKFLLRSACVIFMLIVLAIDYDQYVRIKKSEESIIKIQEALCLEWKLERLEKKLKAPHQPLDLPIIDQHEEYTKK